METVQKELGISINSLDNEHPEPFLYLYSFIS